MLLDLSRRLMGLGEVPLEQVDAIVLGQFAGLALPASRFADQLTAEDVVARSGDEPGPRRLIDMLIRLGAYGDGFGCEPDGLSVARLEEGVHGTDLGALEPRLPEALLTGSDGVRMAPGRIVDDLPRLDRFIEARADDDRLLLIGRRDVRSMNSWLHNLPSLAKGKPRCTLQVSPGDAERLGLDDGGWASLEARVGQLLAQVEVSDRMADGVVSLPHGWGHDVPGVELGVATKLPGSNANRLVDDAPVDVPSGSSVLNGVPVDVKPVPGL